MLPKKVTLKEFQKILILPSRLWMRARIPLTPISTVGIMDIVMLNLVKFGYGGLILGLSQFSQLPQLLQKNEAHFKSGHK